MATLADLHRAVQSTIASKRIGKPVFVRYLLHATDPAGAVVPRLAALAGVLRQWFDQPLERVHAAGTPDSGQVALTLQFRDGATALLCFARGQPRGDGVDLMVVGNRGAVYHDAGSADLWDEAATPPADRPDARLQAAIERALKSGKPESLAEGKP